MGRQLGELVFIAVMLMLLMLLAVSLYAGLVWQPQVNTGITVYANSLGLRVLKTEYAGDALCAKDESGSFVIGADASNKPHRWLLCRKSGSTTEIYSWPKGESPRDW